MDELFPGQPELYDQKQQEWSNFFNEIKTPDWTAPWFNDRFVDGTRMLDGNPIFSAICPNQRRGVSVRQWGRDEGDLDFDFYFDLFGEGEPEETMDLVICCCLEAEAEAKGKEIMREWLGWDKDSPLPELFKKAAKGHDWDTWKKRKT